MGGDRPDPRQKDKPKPGVTTDDQPPLYLAQATPPPPGQITGHPTWGQVAPIARKTVPEQAIKRENEDHGATGSPLPASGTAPGDQARARAGAAAKTRADQSRLANQRELEPNSMGILSATTAAWGAPIATETGRRTINYYQQRYNNPALKALQEPFTALDTRIAQERREMARAPRGSEEYIRLQERIQAYDRLKLGQKKTPDGMTIAENELGTLEAHGGATTAGGRPAFDADELRQLRTLQDQERLLLAQKGEATAALRGNPLGAVGNIGRGVAGATGTYFLDSWASSNLRRDGHDEWAQFMSPSTLEIVAVGGTMTAPVPKFVPGATGPWYARLGARALWEVGVDLSAKVLAYGYDKVTDPAVERRHLDSAKAAQTDDHTKKSPESMLAALNAWKTLSNHDNQIQQVIDETTAQLRTADPNKVTDPNKVREIKRDLVALHGAFGEAWLNNGTRVGGPDFAGAQLAGTTTIHHIFQGKDFDFGGVAIENLNTARNLMNELGIKSDDPVAKEVYASMGSSYMSRILNPHSALPGIYSDLQAMVKKNDPDAKWLSVWLDSRVTDMKKPFDAEERAVVAAQKRGETFTPQFNNYTLAKIYQDKALLDMAYAAAGQDAPTHLRAAHDALKEAQRIGWDGKEIKVKGTPVKRESDLPQLIKYYQSLGGTVDW